MRIASKFYRLLLIIGAASVAARLSAAEVMVFAAASLTESLREIAEDYVKQGGDKIVFNFGGSSTLARQIEEGAPADIFFSADEAQMDRLEPQGLIIRATRRNLLGNSLVIVVAAENGAKVRVPKDLARPEIRRIALGDPKAVPIGVYARKYLEKAGLWQEVASKIVPTENVRGALAAVESGNADASIVYKTDALISKKVVISYAVPPEEGPPIRYPVALVRGARPIEAGQKFLTHLGGEASAKIFERHGFVVLRAPANP